MSNTRDGLIWAFRELKKSGILYSFSGNGSIKINENRYWITPSGFRKNCLERDDILLIDRNGNVIIGNNKPSIEWENHLFIYDKDKKVRVILHTHFSRYQEINETELEILNKRLSENSGFKFCVIPEIKTYYEKLKDEIKERSLCDSVLIIKDHGYFSLSDSVFKAVNLIEEIDFLLRSQVIIKKS